MDNDIVETTDTSLAQDVTRTLILTTAATVGTVAGFVVVGLAMDKFQQFRANRAAKKATQTEE